jgi:hypothetical protein
MRQLLVCFTLLSLLASTLAIRANDDNILQVAPAGPTHHQHQHEAGATPAHPTHAGTHAAHHVAHAHSTKPAVEGGQYLTIPHYQQCLSKKQARSLSS